MVIVTRPRSPIFRIPAWTAAAAIDESSVYTSLPHTSPVAPTTSNVTVAPTYPRIWAGENVPASPDAHGAKTPRVCVTAVHGAEGAVDREKNSVEPGRATHVTGAEPLKVV